MFQAGKNKEREKYVSGRRNGYASLVKKDLIGSTNDVARPTFLYELCRYYITGRQNYSSRHKYDVSVPMSYKNCRSQIISPLVLAAEDIAFAGMLFVAFIIWLQLWQILYGDSVMNLLTDVRCPFDINGKSSRTDDKPLIYDICITSQDFEYKQHCYFGFIRSGSIFSGGFADTKSVKAKDDLFHKPLMTSR